MQKTSIDALLERYEVLLLDAYGVLVNTVGALPGAVALIDRLNREDHDYFIVTNDASRLETSTAVRYQGFGLKIDAERIITSGAQLTPYFAAEKLEGSKCLVLGPKDSHHYVERAGGVPLASIGLHGQYTADEVDILVLGDEAGFDFLEGMDEALSFCIQRIDSKNPARLLLPNPDLIYPKATSQYGFAAGTMALMLEQALALRYPDLSPRFVRLGKPHAAIFETAEKRALGRSMVMIGDQLQTDIQGARAFGIDAVLVSWGLTVRVPPSLKATLRPTGLLEHL